MQALSEPHSKSLSHSCLQPSIGLPKKPSRQEHTARAFSTRQLVLSPHGEGEQKSEPKLPARVRLLPALDLMQETKGSPVNPLGQVHTVMWLRTLHSASTPQEVEHGLMQRLCWHTLSDGQSTFSMHSERLQPVYGSPSNPPRQEQTARLLRIKQLALDPHVNPEHRSSLLELKPPELNPPELSPLELSPLELNPFEPDELTIT